MVCVFALNFTLIPNDPTEMVWYERIEGEFDPTDMKTYAMVPVSELREISRSIIGSDYVALVNTSNYHDVDNKGLPRWCISLRTNMPYKTWEEAVEAFKPIIL